MALQITANQDLTHDLHVFLRIFVNAYVILYVKTRANHMQITANQQQITTCGLYLICA